MGAFGEVMEEVGKVVYISGEQATVAIESKGACGHCAAKTACSPSGDKMYTEAINERGAKVGDTVRMEMNPGTAILSAFLIFFLPIVAFGIGFAILNLITENDNIGVLGGIGLSVVYFLFLRKLNQKLSKGRKFKPIVTEIVKEFPGQVRN